ncbi:hypothetical protein [Mycoplana dimorpha]|uniref:hypothetical protein n=1 Tax=Mycoplana dimorpha TaxID=28320 RepID=UPI0011B1FC47|nr:hypothetical protein [Mycoplana dimorpha]
MSQWPFPITKPVPFPNGAENERAGASRASCCRSSRHDRATKRLRQERNLKAVQRVLNHARITTTAPVMSHQINFLAQFYQRAILLKKIQAQ